MEILRKKYSLEVFKLASLTLWQINYERVHHFTVVVPYLSIRYKVVQIWPEQTMTCLHTNSPGHIWTTLYLSPNVAVRSVQFCTLFGSWFQVSVTEPVFITAVARGLTPSLLTNVMDGFTLNKIANFSFHIPLSSWVTTHYHSKLCKLRYYNRHPWKRIYFVCQRSCFSFCSD